jgi:menaquinone-dependent protoporphyrinogen IX oxidase
LVKVFVVYDTKYGNTKLAAEKIVEGLKEVEGIETAIGYAMEVNPATLADYDAIVIGASNHMARPSRTMTKFVDELAKIDLKAKYAAVFDTYAEKERVDRAMKKLEKIVEKKLPGINLISPGLLVRVYGVTGPVVDGELLKCVDFGKKIAGNLKVNKPNM